MELKYVGAKPIVSGKGVSFDQSHPDSYTFLNAAVELLEALDAAKEGETSIHLDNIKGKEYNGSKLVELLQKYCTDIDMIFASREEETNALIEHYIEQVRVNATITPDERRAWLGNIATMRDYYLQYITNENAYKCALNALADKIQKKTIADIAFPMGRNHGLVMSHLIPVLTHHIPPYDASLSVEEKNGKTFGKLDMNRRKPIEI